MIQLWYNCYLLVDQVNITQTEYLTWFVWDHLNGVQVSLKQ